MVRIIRSVLIVTETVEIVDDRPSRPRSGPKSARPAAVVETTGEDVTPRPRHLRLVRSEPPEPLVTTDLEPLRERCEALSRWIERPLRRAL